MHIFTHPRQGSQLPSFFFTKKYMSWFVLKSKMNDEKLLVTFNFYDTNVTSHSSQKYEQVESIVMDKIPFSKILHNRATLQGGYLLLA